MGNQTATFEETKEWIESVLANYEVEEDNPLVDYNITDFPIQVLDVQKR